MFYDAMLDAGVDQNYAKLLYYGVRVGGPRWKRKLIQASELNRISKEVEAIGGRVQIEHDPTSAASQSKDSDYKIQTVLLFRPHVVTEAELKQFQAELMRRSTQGRPVTLEEIERRTEFPDPPGIE